MPHLAQGGIQLGLEIGGGAGPCPRRRPPPSGGRGKALFPGIQPVGADPQLFGDHFRGLAAGQPVIHGFAFERFIEFTAGLNGCLCHGLVGSLSTQSSVRQFEATRLQLLNAHENVYFRNPKEGWHISKLFEICRKQRKKDKVVTRFFEETDSAGAPIKGQHTYKQNLAFQETLSFCKVRTAKKQVPPENREYGLRQPELVSAHRKFWNEVDAGKYKEEDWGKFLDEIITPSR